MNKEQLQKEVEEAIDNLSMVLHESKKDLRIVSIQELLPIINQYISLSYDWGTINGQHIGRTELLNSIH